MNKKSHRKKRKQAAQQKWLRYGGLAVIVLVAMVALVSWRNEDTTTTVGQTAVLTEPLLDGPADAPIKVVEYADLTCSSCRQWHNMGIKEQLRADFGDQISFEYRHFPVITAASPRWAEAGQCTAEQDAFWPFHDYIYENLEAYPTVNDARLQEIATAIGLDQEAFTSCLDSGRYATTFITDAITRAQRDGARGTPTFFINRQPVSFSYQAMSEVAQNILDN